MKVRYIRESMSGNNENAFCHWVEIQAINYESTNIALNKKATCVGGNPEKGTLDMITNGNTSVDDYVYFRNVAEQTIFVTVDLGTVEDVDNIKVWHYYVNGRTYKNILLEVSLDGVKWTKIFDSNENGEYVEVEAGKTHKLKDDRLPLLNENSSLNEVTSFYEKYIKQDISNKEFLKNVLTSKEIECNDDKMLNLINKVGNIEIGKKWATGTANITSIGNNHYYRVHGLSFTPSVILTRTTNKTSVFHGYYISNLLQGKSRAIRGETDSDTNLYMRLFDVDTTSDTLTDAYCYNGNFSIKMYGSTGAYSSYIFDWIAFE